MNSKKLKFLAALTATIALAFPAQALAITTTTLYATGTNTPVTSMQAEDQIDVTASAPNDFDVSSQVSRDVTRSSLGFSWTTESLQLKTATSITTPEGWEVEYTTNGTTWSTTKPLDHSKITGVRANSSYTKTGTNEFQSTTTATLLATAADFSSGVGGDGFNLTFVDDRIYSVYHHEASIKLNCYLKATGARCPNGSKTFTGYQTPNSSHAWVNEAGDKLFVPSYVSASTDAGIACIDISNPADPRLCSGATGTAFSPFIRLSDSNNMQNAGGAAQVGEKLYIPNPFNWKLTCFDMATGLECVGNGYSTGGVAISATVNRTTGPWTVYGRASNVGGKVFWSSDTHLGCFDPATAGFCGDNAPILIGASVVSTTGKSNIFLESGANHKFQFPMFAVRNQAGATTGVCYFASAQCFTPSGASDDTLLPAGLKSWMKEHPLPKWVVSDSGQLGEYQNKIYFPVGPSDTATNDVYCWDFSANNAGGAACSLFGTNGTKTGVARQIYSIQADPDPLQPNCLWVNSHSGDIRTINANTGVSGCASSQATVKLGYKQLFPRMACAESSRVSAWGVISFNSPGVSASVLRVTVKDSAGASISGYTDRQLANIDANDVNGTLDLSALTIATSGTKPTILVTADLNTAGTLLSQLTAKVNYRSADPQVCIVLLAKIQCATAYTSPTGPTSVGDGVVTTIASYATTRYVGNTSTEYAAVTESTQQNITGTGTATCLASVGGGGSGGLLATPVVTSPNKKRPPVTITISGFRDGSPILTKTIQNRIKAFLKKHNDYPVIETAGFTEGPVVLRTDFALSKARAVNATRFIRTNLKKKFSVVKVKSGQDMVEASKVRRIKITLSDE